jgi:hypothetical protein
VKFTSTDSQAVLPANYTFTATDAGTHTFSVTLKTAGSDSVTATDTITGSITGKASTTVGAAAASMLVVSAPSTATTGTAFNVTVTLKDAYGNVATGFRSPVTFTSTDSQAVLPASYTYTATDAGVHTFSVTLKTVGSQSLTATGGSGMSTTATVSASAVATNLALSGTAYRWSGMTSSTANTGRVAASGLNDGTSKNPVYLNGPGSDGGGTSDASNAWEAAGVVWSTKQTISKAVYVNGAYTSSQDGVFDRGFTLQFTTDGKTWTNAPASWVANVSYKYNSSGAANEVITFTGPATSVLGFRFVGQVHTSDTGTNSWYVITKQVQAF